MGLVESLEAIRNAEGTQLVDWTAAAAAATSSTPRGTLEMSDATERAYRESVIEARAGVQRTVDIDITLPDQIEVIDRHHWIDQAAQSFDRMLHPTLTEFDSGEFSRTVNTGTASVMLAFLGRRVIGQYDPALFRTVDDTALYVVHPNVETVAEELDVDVDLFRRWIMHHEVSHAAEFNLAPWLDGFLEDRLSAVLAALPKQRIDRDAMADLNHTMTAIEGFAELLMDESLDADVTTLRERLEARRAGLGPIQQLIEWALGISAKRQQYRRGRDFFVAISDTNGLEATLAVWETPENLPTEAELVDPELWLDRVSN